MDIRSTDHRSVLSPTMENELRLIAEEVLGNLKVMLSRKFSEPCTASVNTYLWEEGLKSARQSIDFHKDTNTPSLYKELGHICFWLSKLKPVTIDHSNETRAKEIALFHVNEIFAVVFCLKIISYMENYLLSTALQVNSGEITEEQASEIGLLKSDWIDLTTDIAKERRERVKDSVERTQLKLNSLSHSLRYHNYSARAMATSFEWAFAGADSFSWQ